MVAEQVLKSEKWLVVKAFDGLQAVDYMENKATCLPDLILLDIMVSSFSPLSLGIDHVQDV